MQAANVGSTDMENNVTRGLVSQVSAGCAVDSGFTKGAQSGLRSLPECWLLELRFE